MIKFKPFYIFEDKTNSLDRHELEKELQVFGVEVQDDDETDFLRDRLARLYSHQSHLTKSEQIINL